MVLIMGRRGLDEGELGVGQEGCVIRKVIRCWESRLGRPDWWVLSEREWTLTYHTLLIAISLLLESSKVLFDVQGSGGREVKDVKAS